MFLPSSFNSFTGFVLVEWVATDCMNTAMYKTVFAWS